MYHEFRSAQLAWATLRSAKARYPTDQSEMATGSQARRGVWDVADVNGAIEQGIWFREGVYERGQESLSESEDNGCCATS